MIKRAREEGFFDEEELKHGLSLRRIETVQDETVEVVDEEGNVIAGEEVALLKKAEEEDEFFGPLGKWIMEGMKMDDPMQRLGWNDGGVAATSDQALSAPTLTTPATASPTNIHIHTVELPARAPRHLLLELKRIFQTFPGKEKVQLKIGEQMIPLPLTITMSTILEKKIADAIASFAKPAPSESGEE
jgi:hypothetical protein